MAEGDDTAEERTGSAPSAVRTKDDGPVGDADGSVARREPVVGTESREGFIGFMLGQGSMTGLIVKLLVLSVINAVGIYSITVLGSGGAWVEASGVLIATILIDWAYLTPRAVPLKYLVPGTVFLLLFQIYPVAYNTYIAFTNQGTGNILNQDQAIEQILRRSVEVPPDAVRYDARPLVDEDGNIAALLTAPDGELLLGTPEGVEEVDEGEVSGEGAQTTIGDYSAITLGQATEFQDEVEGLRIPIDDGEIQLQTFSSAALAVQTLEYDPERNVMVDTQDGTVYEAVGGNFVGPDGTVLLPGWTIEIGFENFVKVATSPAIAGPFVRVFLWTFVFSIASVITTFVLGLLLAMALNDDRVRGLKYYRAVLIIPYALPSFMTALIWAGLLNTEFGVINNLLGAEIPWLTSRAFEGLLPKLSVILVNTWLGFPYMFLITLGALQAIPGDLKEAAVVDGATGWQAFRNVILPLLMVAVAPLLIASFSFNFNNFNIIFLLTEGGPPIQDAATPAGYTDILITYTYRLAFATGRGADFGLAAAISLIIFILVAIVATISFRMTKSFEEIN